MSEWLGLDIGGANLKAAHPSGATLSVPFPLWKDPARLGPAIADLIAGMPDFDLAAVTMTGELCDCFATKADGVKAILSACVDALGERKVRVWTTEGRFLSVPAAMEASAVVAASNWLATATLAARLADDGLWIDIGSTTADLIPWNDRRPVPEGRTDTDRLRSGELVYAGVKRTPVCALATSLPHRGAMTGLAAELFATTRDVYLTLGDLEDNPDETDTADGRPATAGFARDRLARMIAADRETFSESDARALAAEADASLQIRLVAAARRVIARSLGGGVRTVVVSGSGEFLARRVAEEILNDDGAVVSLRERWGPGRSDASCAFAMTILAAEMEADDDDVA